MLADEIRSYNTTEIKTQNQRTVILDMPNN